MPEILKSIKVMDLEVDRMSVEAKIALRHVNTTYALRTICLQVSEGSLLSYEAYTKSIDQRFYKDPFSSSVAWEYAMHESNYIPERVRDHLRILHAYGIEMMDLSKRLATEKRVFYCIGGNKAIRASVVIDTRLGTPGLIGEVTTMAQATRAVIKYKDIDGPLVTSCLRVLGRDINTEPCPPFFAIAAGHERLRQNRKAVIESFKQCETVESYQLFVADARGNQVLAAEKREGSFVVHDPEVYEQALKADDLKREIAEVGRIRISEDFLMQVAAIPGVRIEAITPYQGMTIADALDARSKEPPFL